MDDVPVHILRFCFLRAGLYSLASTGDQELRVGDRVFLSWVRVAPDDDVDRQKPITMPCPLEATPWSGEQAPQPVLCCAPDPELNRSCKTEVPLTAKYPHDFGCRCCSFS